MTVLTAARLDTPLGAMSALFGRKGLCLLAFEGERGAEAAWRAVCRHYGAAAAWRDDARTEQLRAELAAYFSGSLHVFETELECIGTPFQQTVWRGLQTIAYGETVSYAEQAARLGRAGAARAVAAANARNKISVIVPCHRVIGSDGGLGGYAGGLWRKRALLDLEGGRQQTELFQAA